MTRPVSDWADLMFNPEHRDVAHIVPFSQPYSLCGAVPLGIGGWWGTGDMDEIEDAREMPQCPQCVAQLPTDSDQHLPV